MSYSRGVLDIDTGINAPSVQSLSLCGVTTEQLPAGRPTPAASVRSFLVPAPCERRMNMKVIGQVAALLCASLVGTVAASSYTSSSLTPAPKRVDPRGYMLTAAPANPEDAKPADKPADDEAKIKVNLAKLPEADR